MPGVILAGDIGGTKTHLGLFRADGTTLTPLRDQTRATLEFPSLEAAVADFLGDAGGVNAACFGVPGPVVDGVSHATNVPWDMRESALAAALGGAATRLINDLEATAYGVLHLDSHEITILHKGEIRATPATIAVIAAGTGLGEAALVATRAGWYAVATEGGHSDFAPRGRDQIELLEFLAREFGRHVSFERVLSGPGLHNIYRFLLTRGDSRAPDWLVERMRTEDPSAAISEAALGGNDSCCVRAMEMFVAIYGAEAANLALKFLALGGVYVGGGIAPKILPFLQRGDFVRAFLDKGRLKPTLERIPLRVSLNPAAALLGAAHAAASML
jgi:glucokinase